MKQTSLLIITLLFLCGFLHAQDNTAPPDKTGAWILDKTVSQVDFYHMIKECNGGKTVFLKLNNKNTYLVKVGWAEVFSTQMETGTTGIGGKKSLVIQPGESSIPDCADKGHKQLRTLSSEVSSAYVAVIAKFDFENITVEKVK